jgi:hypothetical protein
MRNAKGFAKERAVLRAAVGAEQQITDHYRRR